MMKNVTAFISYLILLFLIFISNISYAAMVVHEQIGMVSNEEFVQSSFNIKNEGWYYASIKDLNFSDSLDSYGMSINGNDIDSSAIIGKQFAFYAIPGVYYLNVVADTGNNVGLGVYGVQIELLPPEVPIPPAIYLLLSSMISLYLLAKKKAKRPQNMKYQANSNLSQSSNRSVTLLSYYKCNLYRRLQQMG